MEPDPEFEDMQARDSDWIYARVVETPPPPVPWDPAIRAEWHRIQAAINWTDIGSAENEKLIRDLEKIAPKVPAARTVRIEAIKTARRTLWTNEPIEVLLPSQDPPAFVKGEIWKFSGFFRNMKRPHWTYFRTVRVGLPGSEAVQRELNLPPHE